MSGRTSLLLPVAALMAACGTAEAPGDAALSSPPHPPAPAAAVADVALLSASGSSVNGALQLIAAGGGVMLEGEVRGLEPGSTHGFHFHENGDCSAADASSAGDHLNPGNSAHGGPNSEQKHLGDIPNIMADDRGIAHVRTLVSDASIRDGGTHDLVGRALVVHEKHDDYVSQPAGDSGDRIACGVVR